MRHSIEYKHSANKKTIGFINLNTRDYTLDLRIIRSCSRYQPKVKAIHQDIIKILQKHYKLIKNGHNVHQFNGLQASRIARKRRKQDEKSR